MSVTVRAAQEESAWLLQWLAVLTLAGASIIHADQIGVHLEEWLPAGLTFIGLAFVQMGLAAAVLLWPSRAVYGGSLLVSVITVILWTVSRSAGLPFGPEAGEPETVGRPDLIASGLEVVTAGAAMAVLAGLRSGVRLGNAIAVSFISAVAIAVALLTWASVVSPEASSHEDPHSLTGPLVPSDGHSLLVRDTPVVQVEVGETFGLVVGLLNNSSAEALHVRSARLIHPPGAVLRPLRFWVMAGELGRPGVAVPVSLLQRAGRPLPDEEDVPPGERTGLLVLEVRAVREGDYILSAIEVAYEAGGTSYRIPYATVARVKVLPAT
jgi:hypothetical protein